MAKIRELPNSGEKPTTETRRERRPKQKEESNTVKHFLFLALFLFPSIAWVLSVGGDVMNNIGGVFGNLVNGIVISLPVLLPLIIAIYFKKLRGLMLKGVLPVGIAVLLFPSIHVYLCSPIQLRNEDLGTKFGLKTTAAQFLEQSCMQECFNKSILPSSYRLSFTTPRVSITVQFRQIINLNLTTSAMINGQQVKVARLLLLASWRSVKGRYHALNTIARIPVKVKKLEQALKDKQDMVMTGRIVKVSSDLKRLKGELENKQKRFVRPFVLEVHRLLPIEPKEEAKEEKKEETKEKKKKKDTQEKAEEPKETKEAEEEEEEKPTKYREEVVEPDGDQTGDEEEDVHVHVEDEDY